MTLQTHTACKRGIAERLLHISTVPNHLQWFFGMSAIRFVDCEELPLWIWHCQRLWYSSLYHLSSRPRRNSRTAKQAAWLKSRCRKGDLGLFTSLECWQIDALDGHCCVGNKFCQSWFLTSKFNSWVWTSIVVDNFQAVKTSKKIPCSRRMDSDTSLRLVFHSYKCSKWQYLAQFEVARGGTSH